MSGPIDFGQLSTEKVSEYTRRGEAWRLKTDAHVQAGVAAVVAGEPIPPPPAEAKPQSAIKPSAGVIPPQPEKAEAWSSQWEQRYASGYVVRPEDERRWPKAQPPVKPQPVRVTDPEPGVPGEPSSARVIRALEVQINGRVLSIPGGK